MFCSDAAALALAIHRSRQGRPSHTAPHFPVFGFFGEPESLRSAGTLSPFHPQYAGVNSVVTSYIIVGLVSQLWLRRYHPGWYRKYNYILGGALDGGAQVMIFILSFAVFGASGVSRPFPSVSAVRCMLLGLGTDGLLVSVGRKSCQRERRSL